MAKLRYDMPLAELEATMRAEGGTLEKVEGLGEPATARYYRFGDELLRVDGSSSFVWRGDSLEESDLVFTEWHVCDYYVYSPEAEQRRSRESMERLMKMVPDPNAPLERCSELGRN